MHNFLLYAPKKIGKKCFQKIQKRNKLNDRDRFHVEGTLWKI